MNSFTSRKIKQDQSHTTYHLWTVVGILPITLRQDDGRIKVEEQLYKSSNNPRKEGVEEEARIQGHTHRGPEGSSACWIVAYYCTGPGREVARQIYGPTFTCPAAEFFYIIYFSIF